MNVYRTKTIAGIMAKPSDNSLNVCKYITQSTDISGVSSSHILAELA